MLGRAARNLEMTAPGPEVAVVIAAWNAEATIRGAVRSALDQVGPSVEVIVVDDASTDGTAAILDGMADPRLRVLRQAANAGPAAARNRALAASRAPWFTVLDADDAMAPDRLAKLRDIALAGDWDIVADDLWKVESHAPGSPRRRLWRDAAIGVRPLDFAGFVAGNMVGGTAERGELGFLKPLIRRAALDRHGLRYREDMRLGEDFALYAAALARGARACLTDPCGYVALVRSDSLSGRHDAADLRGLALADRWLATLPGLSRADRAALRAHDRETQERWRWMRLIEAVRRRDAVDGLACFAAHPRVAFGLLGRLAEQARLRGGRRLRGLTGRGPAAADRGP